MNHLEDYISNLYQTIGIRIPEELVCENLSSKLNIGLYYWDEKSQAATIHNKPFIFLNLHMLPNFRWQIFCHELCHILFHAGDQMQLPSSFVEYQERKANNFALHAAVPTFMLKEMELPDDYFAAVRVLQDTFSISLTFACKRLDHYINNHIIPLHKTALGEPKLAHHD